MCKTFIYLLIQIFIKTVSRQCVWIPTPPPPTPKFRCLHSALNTPESPFSASAENGCVHMRQPANFTKCAHITFFTYFLCNDNLILISNYTLITKNFILYVCFENKTIMQLHIYHKY